MQINDGRVWDYIHHGEDGGLLCDAATTPDEILEEIREINADARATKGQDLMEIVDG